MKKEYLSKSAEETLKIAENISKNITKPCVIVLSGDLGAGKTTFTKGLAKGLNIQENITSPTFTIMNEYVGKFNLYHFDMYRLENSEEAFGLGFEEYFDTNNLKGICVVEWAENTPNLINKPYILISFTKLSDNERKIVCEEIL